MNRIFQQVRHVIEENNLIKDYDKILIGLSGGPDSVVLFHILLKLKDQMNLTLEVAHINHMVRGDEADRDQKFVEDLCRRHKISCHVLREDMDAYAEDHGLTAEEAGREIRYNFFYQIIDSKSNPGNWKIGLAHNQDDQAETILMRIIRGTGVEGLAGIPIRNGNIIRPLLYTSREEIETYIRDEGLKYVEDKTNFQNDYTRNSIRNELIPFIEERYNQNFKQALLRLSQISKEEMSVNKTRISNLLDIMTIGYNDQEYILDIDLLKKEDRSSQIAVIREVISRILGHKSGFTQSHYQEFANVIDLESGKRVLIKDILVLKSFGHLIIRYNTKNELNEKVLIKDFKKGSLEVNKHRIDYELVTEKGPDIKNVSYIPVNEDSSLTIRKRENGDRIFWKKKYRKLKDFFIDKRVDKMRRDYIPLVEVDNEIYMVGSFYKKNIDDYNNYDKILKVKVEDQYVRHQPIR